MPRDATVTRRKILDAAQQAVLERGFAATSVDRIQDLAEISRGTFFYHFPTKDALARSLIERYAGADRRIVEGFMARAETLARDPLRQVLVFLSLHEELFRGEKGDLPGCLFASYSYEARLFDSRTHALIQESIERWRRVLAAKLEEAVELHPTRVDFDPWSVADLLYGILQGAFVLSRVLDDPGLMIEHTRHARTHVALLFEVEP